MLGKSENQEVPGNSTRKVRKKFFWMTITFRNDLIEIVSAEATLKRWHEIYTYSESESEKTSVELEAFYRARVRNVKPY